MGNAAIVVTLVVTILVSNINAQDNLNDTYQDDQCSIDTRVATLRCLSISLESVQEALNQWDLTNVNRLEINRMSPSKKISRLRSISDDSKMLKLSEIFLVNSGLEELGERSLDGFDTNELESIDLSWNELTQVPQVVLKLGKLRHLDLSHNKIFSLPPGSSFNNLNALATLKLSGNKLGQPKRIEDQDEIATVNGDNSTSSSSSQSVKSVISLLSFNLEPLTDTLEHLELSDNGFQVLPMQFQGRSFARLHHLDFSHNPIKELPSSSFTGMLSGLESLNLEHCSLRNLVLKDEVVVKLNLLQLEGNPLHCDCHARWLWNLAKNNTTIIRLPNCQSPFSAKGIPLQKLPAEELCELLPKSNSRPPRFYRVSQRDESSFSPSTFQSLHLDRIEVQSKSLQVFWNIQLDYYYTDYDWGLIYRQIGQVKAAQENEKNMFFQTRYNLKHHLETHPNWSPKSEKLSAELGGLAPNTFYEICLAVVEHDTVYYVHSELCREVETAQEMILLPKAQISTRNVTVVPHQNSVTLTWNIAVEDPNYLDNNQDSKDQLISVIRQISVRKFGSENATQLFVLEDFNRTVLQKETSTARYYTLTSLDPASNYIVCFETLDSSNRHLPSESKNCQEVVTLGSGSDFPMTEVLTAAAASSLLTFILAAVVFCFCSRQKLNNKAEKTAKTQQERSNSVKDENGNLEVVIHEKGGSKENLEPPGSPNNRSISNSMATTFEPELQSIMTEKETEEIHRDSKFRERYTTQIPKVSSNTQESMQESKTRFWKSCLSNNQDKKEISVSHKIAIPIEDMSTSPKKVTTKKFEETQEYLRRPNALYPPWHSSGPPPEHYHTLPNPHHFHHVHHVPHHTPHYDHYGPGSYHTIAHYQLYKRPMHHICPNAAPAPVPPPPPVPPNHPSGIVMDFHRSTQHDYAQTLGRRKESELMRHPVKLKKLIKSKMLMHQHQSHHHHPVHSMHHEDPMKKMYTWSPYSSHMIYNEPIAGKSLDELRF